MIWLACLPPLLAWLLVYFPKGEKTLILWENRLKSLEPMTDNCLPFLAARLGKETVSILHYLLHTNLL
jgi:hypothetical protein